MNLYFSWLRKYISKAMSETTSWILISKVWKIGEGEGGRRGNMGEFAHFILGKSGLGIMLTLIIDEKEVEKH